MAVRPDPAAGNPLPSLWYSPILAETFNLFGNGVHKILLSSHLQQRHESLPYSTGSAFIACPIISLNLRPYSLALLDT